jgi:hypothetical protein
VGDSLRLALIRHLRELSAVPPERLREQRDARIAGFGIFSDSGA